MSRFYIPKESVMDDKTIVVKGKEAHHIASVMRLGLNDLVTAFDGTGKEYIGSIKDIDRKNKIVTIELTSQKNIAEECDSEIVLAQAIPKKDKMDYIVEKSTELGVGCIIPLITKRTIVKPHSAESSNKMVQRWQNLAIQASKQCGRLLVPKVSEITRYNEFVLDTNQYDLVLSANLVDEKTVFIREALAGFTRGKVLVLIGPEGDFTREEIGMLTGDNVRFISLGRRVLKSDTAGLFVLSVLNYVLGGEI